MLVVGGSVGTLEGAPEGDMVGNLPGDVHGDMVGITDRLDGVTVEVAEGITVGKRVGTPLGSRLSLWVAIIVWTKNSILVGELDGNTIGLSVRNFPRLLDDMFDGGSVGAHVLGSVEILVPGWFV